jgi:hypothetical protein
MAISTLRTIIATRTALAKCYSENWPSWLKKMAVTLGIYRFEQPAPTMAGSI